MPKALVTLAVGSGCLDPWARYLRSGWAAWCRRHGYELVVFTKPLDSSFQASKRSPAWQKLLAMASPELSAFDQALWVDADVLIAEHAPDPLHGVNQNMISMARDVGSPLSAEPLWFKEIWRKILRLSLQIESLDSYYDLWGFSSSRRVLYNTGVIGFSPRRHRDVFLGVYDTWMDGGPGALHEMIPLNLVVQQLGLILELDVRFNQLAGVQKAVWLEDPVAVQQLHAMPDDLCDIFSFLEALKLDSYFLHFAGAHQLMMQYLRRCAELADGNRSFV